MFTQTAIYALRAMAYLASEDVEKPVLSQTIAREMNIPKNFLSKILNQLVRANLVRSTRGTKGGFVLAKDPSEIKMIDVVTLFMDVGPYRKCLLGRDECNGDCRVHVKWGPIVEKIEDMLNTTRIDELL